MPSHISHLKHWFSSRIMASVLQMCLALVVMVASAGVHASPATFVDTPELAYLKVVNQWRPPSDPQLLFLLMGQFANAGRSEEGIAYFEDKLQRFAPQINDVQKALYLTAIANLRANHANDVFLPQRIVWVRDTLAMLDEAKRLTGNNVFIVRWMSGVVRSRVPRIFGEQETAYSDLNWCLQHAGEAPNPGFLREVYAQLGEMYLKRGNPDESKRLKALGGLTDDSHTAVFTTVSSEDVSTGHRFSPRAIREVVPGSVYALSGIEFTEYYFIVSADRRELISIDSGTRPDAAKEAYETLQAHVPWLPPLTTVFITHAHWDHVGGHAYFRSLNPKVRFYGRSSNKKEIALDAMGNPEILRRFFGSKFRLDDVLGYKPDVAIDHATDVVIGGTHFSLLPTQGGETDDALMVHMPAQGVLFVGDILMPYLGAPFVAEGNLDGMLASIDQVRDLKPAHLLHGHEPLTRLFSSVAMLDDLRGQLTWLRDEVLKKIKAGEERGEIQQANLIAPNLSRSRSDVHIAYLVLRENVINRLYEQNSGYWQNGLHGLDALTNADEGAALIDYLGVSESQIASAAEHLVHDGKHEMAARLLSRVQSRFPNSDRLNAARRKAYLKLMEKYQDFNPFKFIMYHSQIDLPVPQVTAVANSRPSTPGLR